MRKIKCYICLGIFKIDEQYREVEYQVLKRKRHHIAEDWERTAEIMGICCPYCHNHLFEKLLKIAG